MKKLRKNLCALSALIVSALALPLPVLAQGPQAWSGVCVGDETLIPGSGDVATIRGLQCLLGNVLSVAISAIGFIGFVMIIFSAYRFMTSGGNSKGVEASRNTLTWAVIGLLLALASISILRVIAEFTGVNLILDFNIPIVG